MHVIFSSVLFLGVFGMMCFVGNPCRIFEWRWFLCGSHVGFCRGDWDGEGWMETWQYVGIGCDYMCVWVFGMGCLGLNLDMGFLWGFRERMEAFV